MQILIRTLKRKKFLTRRYHWSKKRFLRNLSRVSLRKTWYTTNHDRSINETSRPGSNKIETDPNDSGRDNGSSRANHHIRRSCQTYRMSDRTTRFGTFTCTHCSKHWIKAIATPGHSAPIHPLLAYPGQNLCASNPGGWPIALHAAKAIVTMLKVVFTFRYVTPDTGDNGKSTNSEQSGTRPPSTLLS